MPRRFAWASLPDDELLKLRFKDLKVAIPGTWLERCLGELYAELAERGLRIRPHAWVSNEWFSPDDTPGIAIPFYLAHPRLMRLERKMIIDVEGGTVPECMRILRHEAGHVLQVSYQLHRRRRWQELFGPSSTRYPRYYRPNPISRRYVYHLPLWYAQSHPDEDFAETFAVWLTPGLDWRSDYAGWEALTKLEYVDRIMAEIRELAPAVPAPTEDDLPVESMHYTVAEHYDSDREDIPIGDARQFDADLRRIFATPSDAPSGMAADEFMQRHYREVLVRLSYWTGETPGVVRSLLDHLITRARALGLRVSGLEAATLVELTAFGTAVVMNYRNTQSLGRTARRYAEAAGDEATR